MSLAFFFKRNIMRGMSRMILTVVAAALLGAGCLPKSAGWPTAQPSVSQPTAASPAAVGTTSTAPLASPPAAGPSKAPAQTKPKTAPSTSTAKPANGYVLLAGFKFSPQILALNVGATVFWTNKDTVNHTVDSDAPRIFNSGNLPPGATFQHVFNSPGTYTYHCSVHPEMTGTIVVR